MRQLLLDLLPDTPPSLDNFVLGINTESFSPFCEWLSGKLKPDGFCLALWGESGSGKTHLLQASGFDYHNAADDPDLSKISAMREMPEKLAIDHVESLSETGQVSLFNAFNRLYAANGHLLAAAQKPPAHLVLREDLRTRLGSGLQYRLYPLSDEEKIAALCAQAKNRAMNFSEDMAEYLIRRAPRDMRTLSSILAALNHYALEQKRPVTLALLRGLLHATLRDEQLIPQEP